MRKKKWYVILTLFLCFFLNLSVMADSLHSVRIRQVYLFQDVLRVYVNIDDINGNSLESVKKTEAVGYLDQKKLTTNSVKKFYDSGEGVADVFLVDTSKSLNDEQMQQVKAAMRKWASEMKPSDRMAIITFGEEVNTILDYTNDMDAISKAIEGIQNSDRKTKLYGAVDEGMNLCMRSDTELPKRRNMVLVTDGQNDFNGGVSLEDVCDQLKKKRIPIYCLWLQRGSEDGESAMNTLAETSGGEKYNLGTNHIDSVYEAVKTDIQNTFVIDFAYSDLDLNGTASNLELKVTSEGKTPSDMIDTVFNAPTEKSGLGEAEKILPSQTGEEKIEEVTGEEKETDEEEKEADEEETEEEDDMKKYLFIMLGVLLILLVVILIIFLILRQRKNRASYGDDFDAFDTDHISDDTSSYEVEENNETVFIPSPFSECSKEEDSLTREPEQIAEITVKLLDMNTGELKTVLIKGRATLGRKSRNDFVIDSSKVSGTHCILSVEGEDVFLEDAGSTNGTKLNGTSVLDREKVTTGDMITIADKIFEIEIEP